MTKNRIWEILEIEPTNDTEVIAGAYRRLLPSVNPEDDAEGFKNLREAYEEAIALAKENKGIASQAEGNVGGTDSDGSTAASAQELSDIGRFMKKVEQLYEKIPGRCDVSAWDELLNEPICQGLDTCIEVREKVLAYLMDHFYLPSEVFRRLDREFHFVEEQAELNEMFPTDFLQYLERQVKNDNFLPYELLEVVSVSDDKDDADTYIRSYYDLKRALDEGQQEGIEEKINHLSKASVRHPYLNVEKMRYLMLNGQKEEAMAFSEKLMKKWSSDEYVVYQCAKIWFDLGMIKEAHEAWEKQLEEIPDHYGAKCGLALCYQKEGNAAKAKETSVDILEQNGEDEKMNEVMRWANEILIREYEEKIQNDPDNIGDALEMGWCLFQNERDEETIALLDRIQPDDKEHERDYCNLRGRCLYNMKRYEDAIPDLKKWLHFMDELVGTDVNPKKIRRRGYAASLLAMSYQGLAREFDKDSDEEKRESFRKEAEVYFNRAVELEKNDFARLFYENNLAAFYHEGEEYEKVVDMCDRILKEDSGYYPAYLQRQKAFFELRNAQGVVDDYHAAVEIVPNFFGPYVYAAKVFYIFDQYEDVKDVVTRAKDAGAWCCSLALYEIKAGRMLAESNKERVNLLALADELEFHKEELEDDVEDWSEFYSERAMLCLDTGDYDEGLEQIEKAIKLNDTKHFYLWIKADLLKGKGNIEDALRLYQIIESKLPDNAGINYDMARCYALMKEEEQEIKQYKKALEKDPDHRQAHNKLMNLYQRKYNRTYKQKYYNMALKHAGGQLDNLDNSYFRIERAILLLDGYETEAALEDLQESIKTEPDNLYSYNNMGFAYRLDQKWDLAIEHFRKAIALMSESGEAPETILPYSNLADCYEVIGEYEKAIQCLEKNLTLFPKHISIYEDMGDVYVKMGKYEKAIECYKRLGELSDGDPLSKASSLSEAYAKLNQEKMAEECLKHALKTDSLQGSIKCMRYYMQVKRDFKKAWKYLKKIERLLLTQKEVLAGYDYMNMAELCSRLGKEKSAKKYAQLALKRFLKSGVTMEEFISYPNKGPWNCSMIARYYQYSGDTKRAEELFLTAAGMRLCCNCKEKACFDVYEYLGRLYEQIGDYDKALQNYRKAQEICPSDSELPAALQALSKRK